MITVSPQDFIYKVIKTPLPNVSDHHHTGPITCQQSEGQGSVAHSEGTILSAFASKFGGPVLEIGSDLGISSRYILEALDRRGTPDDILIAVDYFHKWDEDILRRVRIDADTSCFCIRNQIPDYEYAWAFIDGDHRYGGVLNDIELVAHHFAVPRIFFHDCRLDFPRATGPSNGSDAHLAVCRVLENDPDWILTYIATPCGLIYAQRSNL